MSCPTCRNQRVALGHDEHSVRIAVRRALKSETAANVAAVRSAQESLARTRRDIKAHAAEHELVAA
ncbi:hypothetical protein [Micromonospora sp. NPDC048839]|uniref:hypothetical protein n=1 Tax=Micromonospora sp. NPDC048839 TaxID=3155641 RepID=UPI0033C66D7E